MADQKDIQLGDISNLQSVDPKLGSLSKTGKMIKHDRRRYMYSGIGVVVLVAVLAFAVGISYSTHDQETYNQSQEVLRSLSSANGIRVKITMSGSLVARTGYSEVEEDNSASFNKTEAEIESDLAAAYVGYNSSDRPVFEAKENSLTYVLTAIPRKSASSSDAVELDMRVTYEHNDGSEYDIVLLKDKGYYTRTNVTSKKVIVTNCLTQEYVPPVHLLAESILNANVLPKAEISDMNMEACDKNAKIIHATWSGHQYLYCLEGDHVKHLAGSNLAADIEYLTPEEASNLEGTFGMPTIYNIDGAEMQCPKLTFDEHTAYFADAATAKRRRLSSASFPVEERWWNKRQLSHPSIRKLATSIDTYYVTNYEYDSMKSAMVIMECTHYCLYDSSFQDGQLTTSYTSVPIVNFNQFVIASSTAVRRLNPSGRSLTLSRSCVFLHGAGYQENENLLSHNFQQAFGYIHENKPCYCHEVRFLRINTFDYAWYDTKMQKTACDRILYADPVYRETRIRHIQNYVIFTHFTASLTFGAALENNHCSLASSSKWITLQAPVKGTIVADELPSKICTAENIERARKILEITKNMNSVSGKWHESKQYMFKVISTCSPHEDTAKQMAWLGSLIKTSQFSYGDPVAEYEKSMKQLGLRVDAALCGVSASGMLNSNSDIIKMSQEMGFGAKLENSDGITPRESCKALAAFKLEFGKQEVSFGNKYTDRFYEGAVAQSDIPLYADSSVDPNAKYRKWMAHLNLHTDA